MAGDKLLRGPVNSIRFRDAHPLLSAHQSPPQSPPQRLLFALPGRVPQSATHTRDEWHKTEWVVRWVVVGVGGVGGDEETVWGLLIFSSDQEQAIDG